jgi:toxin YoeB
LEESWKDYLYWEETDKKKLKRINELIKDIQRSSYKGIGKPEPLKYQLQGCWSRRIDNEHRIVYEIVKDEIRIVSCRFHY